jgi:putative ABC transport system permease protein
MKRRQPPRLPEWLLSTLCREELVEEIMGDMYEYYELLSHQPAWKRHLLYWFHSFQFLRPRMIKKLPMGQNSSFFGLFRANLRMAFRSYSKNKLVSGLSLATLVFGVVCFQLVYAWITNEQSMDDFHSKGDRIHLVVGKLNPDTDWNAFDVQRMFNINYAEIPHVEKSMVVHSYRPDEIKLVSKGMDHRGKALIVDSTFFDFFDFELTRGTRDVLNDRQSIVITKAFASRVFGKEDPMGQVVDIKCDQTGTYKVAGLVEKIPSNSSISFDFLVPRQSSRFWRRMPQNLILGDAFFDQATFDDDMAVAKAESTRFPESVLSSFPLKSIYLDRSVEIPLFAKYGNRTNNQIMEGVALVLLLITLVSFVNLQTSLQLTLVRKIGVKYIIGASRFDVGLEIAVSRFIYLIAGGGLAFLLYQWLFPYYVGLLELDLDSTPSFDMLSMFTVMGGIVLVSWLVSFVQVCRLKTSQAIAGKLSLKIPRLQRVLTTLQYAITILLLVATSVVFLQLGYMLNKDTGLHQHNIVQTDFFEIMPNQAQDSVAMERMMRRHDYVLNQLNNHPGIRTVSQGTIPIDMAFESSWKIASGDNEYTPVYTMPADPYYADVFGMELVEGRFFSDTLDNNNDNKLVINEAAKTYWGIDDISRVKLTSNSRSSNQVDYTIIGVVKDYHYQHLSHKIRPLILSYSIYQDTDVLVRVEEGHMDEAVTFLGNLYREVNPGGIFAYQTMEDKIDAQYAAEKRLSSIYLTFSAVALVLSSIGLFTFAFHETRRRTKEVGIRKVSGAGFEQVFWLLNLSFLKSVAVAFVLATPLVWYLMRMWLDNFAYRVELSWWIFAGVAVVVLVVAMSTVLWQTISLSKASPVESLRYE